MAFENHVSLPRDITALMDYSPAIATGHPYISGSTGASLPMIPHIEIPMPMLWPTGFALGKNKFTSTVYHCGLWIAQQGHDVGNGITHIPGSPDCVLAPIHILMSSRKAKFYAAETKANGKGIAACTMFDIGVIPTPMVPCSQLPLPVVGTGTAVLFNSLIVGMNPWQMLACWAEVLVSIVLAVLKLRGAASGAGASSRAGASAVVEGRLDSFIMGKLMVSVADPAEIIAGLVGGALRGLAQQSGGFHGDAELKVNLLDGPAAAELGVSRSGDDGRVTGSALVRSGNEGVAEVHSGLEVAGGGSAHRPSEAQVAVGGGVLSGSGEARYSTNRPESVRGRGGSARGVYGHTESPFGGSDFGAGGGSPLASPSSPISGDPTEGLPEL